MKKPRKHRGLSFGSVVMLLLTAVVCCGLGYILPKLQGDAVLEIDASKLAASLQLDKVTGLPQLSLMDIPIHVATAVPTATPSPASANDAVQHTAAPLATPEPTIVPVEKKTVTMTFGGSILIADKLRKSVYYSDVKDYDFTEYLSLLSPSLKSDLTMVTLEDILREVKSYDSVTLPPSAAAMFSAAGINVVAAGFPNAYDAGQTGLSSTLDALRREGVTPVGLYAEASCGRMLNINGINVGILHYTSSVSSKGMKKLKADDAEWALPVFDASSAAKDVARMRASGADIIIVSLIWGSEDSSKPSSAQQQQAQTLSDASADIIIGTGPRAVQPVTLLTGYGGNKTLCAWSLGTLLSATTKAQRQAGMLLHVTASVENGRLTFDTLTYTPTYIWNYTQDGGARYRVVAAHHIAPAGMGEKQKAAMASASQTIFTVQEDSQLNLEP